MPNRDLTLWPGQYVNVVLDAGVMPAMTSIPTVAVQPGQQGLVRLRGRSPDDTVEVRPVEVALAEGANSAIGKGLQSGERVVIEGQDAAEARQRGARRRQRRPLPRPRVPAARPVRALRPGRFADDLRILHPAAGRDHADVVRARSSAALFAYRFLPVAALPSAEFPVVNVSASLPGASPETMATSVATPLIKQFATIAGIDSISTTNSLGSTSIAIQFVLDRDIDAAAADVQAAIARTQRSLPPEMTSPPSYRKVNPADAPILLMALVSDTVPLTELDAFAENVISPALSTIDGVAQVAIFGSQKYAVRIQIDPTALAARGIGIDQLQNAVAAANSNTPARHAVQRPASS